MGCKHKSNGKAWGWVFPPLADAREAWCRRASGELTPHEGELEFWDKIMRSTRQPMQRRMKAAELGAQYKYAPISEAQLVRSTLLTEQAPVKRTAREIADS